MFIFQLRNEEGKPNKLVISTIFNHPYQVDEDDRAVDHNLCDGTRKGDILITGVDNEAVVKVNGKEITVAQSE